MPYYIFDIEQASNAIVRKLTLLAAYKDYREAKVEVRKLRASHAPKTREFKIIFAESELQAEELLQEKREEPVLMEGEK